MARFGAQVLGRRWAAVEEPELQGVSPHPVHGVAKALEYEVRNFQASQLRLAGDGRRPDGALLLQLCLCCAIEGADIVLLPSTLKALQVDLGLSMHRVAGMALAQAVCLSAMSPLWGILADRRILRRKTVLAFGACCQGVLTVLLGCTTSYTMMAIVRALNGTMLSALRPIVGGIVPDVTSPEHRGKVFGWVALSVQSGMVVGTLIAVPISMRTVWGVAGWRLAYALVGALSVLVGVFVQLTMVEPEREFDQPIKTTPGDRFVLVSEAKRLFRYLKMPTFACIVAQGCFGTVPGNALAYETLYFQLSGVNNRGAAYLEASRTMMSAIGHLLGGRIGDWMSQRFPGHGRQFTAQLSILAGIPIAFLMFTTEPLPEGAFHFYLALVVMLGLLSTWCATGANLPLLSELVDADGRSAILAWDQALEGSFAALFGNLAVGVLSEDIFGYDLKAARARLSTQPDTANQHALGMALMLTCCVPWSICLCFYTLLHWSYPRDLRRKLERCKQAEALVQRPELVQLDTEVVSHSLGLQPEEEDGLLHGGLSSADSSAAGLSPLGAEACFRDAPT